jgi:hypothetical protein
LNQNMYDMQRDLQMDPIWPIFHFACVAICWMMLKHTKPPLASWWSHQLWSLHDHKKFTFFIMNNQLKYNKMWPLMNPNNQYLEGHTNLIMGGHYF